MRRGCVQGCGAAQGRWTVVGLVGQRLGGVRAAGAGRESTGGHRPEINFFGFEQRKRREVSEDSCPTEADGQKGPASDRNSGITLPSLNWFEVWPTCAVTVLLVVGVVMLW